MSTHCLCYWCWQWEHQHLAFLFCCGNFLQSFHIHPQATPFKTIYFSLNRKFYIFLHLMIMRSCHAIFSENCCNCSVEGKEPVTWFSRVSQLGRNRGYGGTRWVVMIMWLTIYKNTKKGDFDGVCKWPQEIVWDGISKKGNFDRLCKQVMWPIKKQK